MVDIFEITAVNFCPFRGQTFWTFFWLRIGFREKQNPDFVVIVQSCIIYV